jgi:hypothetical protein
LNEDATTTPFVNGDDTDAGPSKRPKTDYDVPAREQIGTGVLQVIIVSNL